MYIGKSVLAKKDGKVIECIVIDFSQEDILLEDKETKEQFKRMFWEVRNVKNEDSN